MAALRLAIASDLYVPVTPLDRVRDLVRSMAAFAPDAVVLAGNLAESHVDFVACLKLVRQELTCPVWVLPGDHDFWARPPHDSHRLWCEVIPQAVAAHGCSLLQGTAFVQSGVAVAGTIAWYDYSSANSAGLFTDLEFARHKYEYSGDALRIDWEWSDPEFAAMVSTPFLATLDQLDADPEVRSLVVVTHFPILEQQLVRAPGQGMASAYLGNLTLGQKVIDRPRLSHVVSGHLRQGREVTIERPGLSPVVAHVLASDYENPAWIGLTVEG